MDALKLSSNIISCFSRLLVAKRLSHNASHLQSSGSSAAGASIPLGPFERRKNARTTQLQFKTNILDTPRDRIMRQIIRRRRQVNTEQHDKDGSLYELAEAYLEAEHEMLAAAPSQDALTRHKISQVLQQRFNYNPIQSFALNHDSNRKIALESQESVTFQKNRRLYVNEVKDEGDDDISESPGENNDRNATASGSAPQDGTEHRGKQNTMHSKETQQPATDLEKVALCNGTILEIDLSAVKTVEKNHKEDVFDSLGSLRLNEEMLNLWTSQNVIDVIYFNESLLPIVSTSAEAEYFHIRNKAALINKSYALPIMVSGKDAADFLEHFVTCSLKNMKRGMVQYTALVDTQGNVMDMAYVAAYENSYLLVTNGLQKRNLFDYMTAYQVSCKRSGLDVTLRPLLSFVLISFQGPKAADILQAIAKRDRIYVVPETKEDITEQEGRSEHAETLNGCAIKIPTTLPPFMRCIDFEFTCPYTRKDGLSSQKTYPIHCMRVSDVGEDGFEMLVSSDAAIPLLRLLRSHPDVVYAGFEAYDSARMEAGIIRSDVDIPTESSPIQAAVTWSVDTNKLRSGSLFGRKHMTSQLINGVAKLRVGLIANERVDTNCNILNGDTRKPIGFVTSCSWSYGLKMYLAQAYINAECARHDMPVLLSLPLKPEAPVTKREFRKNYRNKTRRTIIRGTVVRLPFVLHNYPINESQKHYIGGRHVPLQTLKKQPNAKGKDEAQAVPGQTANHSPLDGNTASVEENAVRAAGTSDSLAVHADTSQQPTRLKTRKQLWKEVVNKQRIKNAKTLEMALTQVEKATVDAYIDKQLNGEPCTEQMPLQTQRINIIPRATVPLEKTIEYYRELHSKPVPSRHRRYRPPIMGGQANLRPTGRLTPVGFAMALLLLLSVFLYGTEAQHATIGVDWGEEYVEVAIAFRGHKPDILLNDTGSRKFVNAVYLDGKMRLFDQKAAANLVKSPSRTVHKSAHILGMPVHVEGAQEVTPVPKDKVLGVFNDHGIVFDWDYAPYEFGADDAGQLYLNIRKEGMVKVEEAAGHFFDYIKMIITTKLLASKVIQAEDTDISIMAVVTIPCNYKQHQRKAIIFAAESAGITVAGLVHGITAASIVRAFEQGPGTKKLLFYDLGSSGANVGVVEIQVPEKDRKKSKGLSNTHITMLSCVTQQGIGGRHHDVVLAQHLRTIFEKKTKIELMPQHPNALQKLLKAANKAKIALTISESTNVSIDGLIRNVDFASETVTRQTFNELISGSIDQLENPVKRALELAGDIKLEELDGVELVGGGWRVPAVQEKLSEILKPHPLGFHLNAEEAMAMGAGYLAAAHNPFFKMKSANVAESSLYLYAIRIFSIDSTHPDAMEKSSPLFKPDSKLQGTKTVVFKTNIDFELELTENGNLLTTYRSSGITDAMSKEENKGKVAQITLAFTVNATGVIELSRHSASFVEVAPSDADDASNANQTTADGTAEGAGESASDTEEGKEGHESKEQDGQGSANGEQKTTEPESNEQESAESGSGEQGNEPTNEDERKEADHKEQESKAAESKEEDKKPAKPLTFEFAMAAVIGQSAFTPEKLEATDMGIKALHKRDMDIVKLSERKNTLESLIYKYKSAARRQEFQEACDEATMATINALLHEYEEWFDEDSYDATLEQFEERISKLEEVSTPVYQRWSDNEARPSLIASTNKSIAKLMQKFDELLEKKPYVAEETEMVDKFKSVQTWWEEVLKQQDGLKPNEEPAFTAGSIKMRLEIAKQVLSSLEKVPKPKPAPEEKKQEEAKETEHTAEESSQEPKEEEPTTDKGEQEQAPTDEL
ncbi:family domain containing protein [Babesia ovata]|uniref:Family domain containing protein n=1 Tax=Babesia ovata TaxID=189622 RepID=A0A2H6KDX1_9APIC|nr:family domain containing protein [Babesia ovata]GBE61200.1 family domain containing protein [Babesia ovata]